MTKLTSWKTCSLLCILCAATVIAAHAQTFTTLHRFSGPDGDNPLAGLVQGSDGNFYGTTSDGGSGPCSEFNNPGCGTVFKITPEGVVTTLHNFTGRDGYFPVAGLVLGADGNFYGTTKYDGTGEDNCNTDIGCGGTVFKITPEGVLTTLHNFCTLGVPNCTDGNLPEAGLIQAGDGNFYGTTTYGGTYTYCPPGGCGTVFKITPTGTLTTHSLHSGANNPVAGLVQGTDGNFYGTTEYGGDVECNFDDCGMVFKITNQGFLYSQIKLHSFDLFDGSIPTAALVQGTDGNFYGTTEYGGNVECNFDPGCGTVFKITPEGVLTTLHNFTGGADGANPTAGLLQATDGNFYGTTEYFGPYGSGTIFKITPTGQLTTLHSFNLPDGIYPAAALVQGTDGKFYGTTSSGGNCAPYYCGTIFQLSMGLEPFVATNPASGVLGTAVVILGNNLTGATSVELNGTHLPFTVISDSEIQITVPTEATTGRVTVVTPQNTLKSNRVFRVTPQLKRFSRDSGPVGTVLTITGVSLTQTTQVTFGGVQASFEVNSDSEVTTTVPIGAKSGLLAVATPGGIVDGLFLVTP
jgi:uncharacterized repeat protein (TIGR03803 family)